MKELDSAARRALRARAHHLDPVVMIGEAGLTPQVLREIDLALKTHELIKIRVLGEDRAAREQLVTHVCNETRSQPVQSIGKILVIYRERPPEPETAAPKPQRPRRRVARRPKRSYQSR